jgi:hypothetical protein
MMEDVLRQKMRIRRFPHTRSVKPGRKLLGPITSMSAINQDAQRMSLLFQYGVVPADEVIAWADSWIVRMDSPPDSLFELSSTSPSNTGDILACLRQLSAGADFWIAFRAALPRLRDYVASHRDRAESIADHLYRTACSFQDSGVPDDLRFVWRFDDAFSLAREGIYGDSENVYREFVQCLDEVWTN